MITIINLLIIINIIMSFSLSVLSFSTEPYEMYIFLVLSYQFNPCKTPLISYSIH